MSRRSFFVIVMVASFVVAPIVGAQSISPAASRATTSCWEVLPSPPQQVLSLTAINGLAANDLWVGGPNVVAHYTGTWQTSSLPTNITSIVEVSATDVWAAGGNMYHFDGTAWVTQTMQTAVSAVVVTSGNIIAVGGNAAYRFDGTSWNQITVPGGVSLNAVSSRSDGTIYAVGSLGNQAVVVTYDGTSFQTTTTFPSSSSLAAANGDLVGGSMGVGINQRPLVARFNGATWVSENADLSFQSNIKDVSANFTVGSGDLGGGSLGLVFTYASGGNWAWDNYAPSSSNYNGVLELSSGTWIVGSTGSQALLAYQPANCPTPTPTNTPLATDTPTNTPTPIQTPMPGVTPTDCANPFTDLNGNIFYPAIHALYCRGVVNGTGATTFGPAGTSTRGQFAKVVVLGFGIPAYTPTTPNFTDVPSSYYSYTYIETGFHAGILGGYDQATCGSIGAIYPCYGPNRPITRAQITKLVVSAAGYNLINPPTPTFSDVGTSNVFYRYIETAAAKGVVNGTGGGHFSPNINIRRDQMCQIVYKGITTP